MRLARMTLGVAVDTFMPFGDAADARAHEGLGSLDLDDAETAGRVGRNILEMAERGDLGARRGAGLEEARTRIDEGRGPVYRYGDHLPAHYDLPELAVSAFADAFRVSAA